MSCLFPCITATSVEDPRAFPEIVEAGIRKVLTDKHSPTKPRITLFIPNYAGFGEIEGGSKIAALLQKRGHILQICIKMRPIDDEKTIREKFPSMDLVFWSDNKITPSLIEKVKAFNPVYFVSFPALCDAGYQILHGMTPRPAYLNLSDFGHKGLLGIGMGQLGLLFDKDLMVFAKDPAVNKKQRFLSSLSPEDKSLFFGTVDESLIQEEGWDIAIGYSDTLSLRKKYIDSVLTIGFEERKTQKALLLLSGKESESITDEQLKLLATSKGIQKLTVIRGSSSSSHVLSEGAENAKTLVIVLRRKLPSDMFRFALLQSEIPALVTGVFSLSQAIACGIPFFYERLYHKKGLWKDFCMQMSLPQEMLSYITMEGPEEYSLADCDHSETVKGYRELFKDASRLEAWKADLRRITETKDAAESLPLLFQETSVDDAQLACQFFTSLEAVSRVDPLNRSLFRKLTDDPLNNSFLVLEHFVKNKHELARHLVITGNLDLLRSMKSPDFSAYATEIIWWSTVYNQPQFIPWCRDHIAKLEREAVKDILKDLLATGNLPYLQILIQEFYFNKPIFDLESLVIAALDAAVINNLDIFRFFYEHPKIPFSRNLRLECLECILTQFLKDSTLEALEYVATVREFPDMDAKRYLEALTRTGLNAAEKGFLYRNASKLKQYNLLIANIKELDDSHPLKEELLRGLGAI